MSIKNDKYSIVVENLYFIIDFLDSVPHSTIVCVLDQYRSFSISRISMNTAYQDSLHIYMDVTDRNKVLWNITKSFHMELLR